jgi:hypothetical protein
MKMRNAHVALITLLVLLSCAVAVCQSANENVYFFVQPDSFSATGKWAATSSNPKDQISMPQEVEIDCSKSTRTCVEATAEYYSGHAHISLGYPSVAKWDRDGIIATDSHGICMSRTILINFSDQTITVTHSLKKLDEKRKEACAFFGAEKTESYAFVVKGTARWKREALETLR